MNRSKFKSTDQILDQKTDQQIKSQIYRSKDISKAGSTVVMLIFLGRIKVKRPKNKKLVKNITKQNLYQQINEYIKQYNLDVLINKCNQKLQYRCT